MDSLQINDKDIIDWQKKGLTLYTYRIIVHHNGKQIAELKPRPESILTRIFDGKEFYFNVKIAQWTGNARYEIRYDGEIIYESLSKKKTE